MRIEDRERLLQIAETLERRISSTHVDVDRLAASIREIADPARASTDGLTFSALKTVNDQRCRLAFPECDDWTPSDWGVALAGEAGEACNFIKKLRRGDDVDATEVGKELADVVIYADLLATRLGLDLERHVVCKFNEVSRRRECPISLPV